MRAASAGFFFIFTPAFAGNAPVAGIVLILETSGGFDRLFGVVLVSLSAFVTAALMGLRPVYEVLFERLFGASRQF
jgi:H+/Cl- antiporter ClcA